MASTSSTLLDLECRALRARRSMNFVNFRWNDKPPPRARALEGTTLATSKRVAVAANIREHSHARHKKERRG